MTQEFAEHDSLNNIPSQDLTPNIEVSSQEIPLWITIPDSVAREISSSGEVRNSKTKHVLKTKTTKRGECISIPLITGSSKTMYIKDLIAVLFGIIPPASEELTNENSNSDSDTSDKQTIPFAELLVQSMEEEGCKLISDYISKTNPILYIHEGLEYKTTPQNWMKGIRAHKQQCIQYTHNHVKELFRREGCELLNTYMNTKSMLTYKFEDKEYEIRFDNWKYANQRPHKRK